MNNIQKRFLLFLIGCIGTRTLFAYIAKISSPRFLRYLGYLALLVAIGFMYFFLSGKRKTGGEVFGEKIWWNPLRPIHAIMYFLFAYNAILGNRRAWIYLAMDVIFGLFSFLVFHYLSGNYKFLVNKN